MSLTTCHLSPPFSVLWPSSGQVCMPPICTRCPCSCTRFQPLISCAGLRPPCSRALHASLTNQVSPWASTLLQALTLFVMSLLMSPNQQPLGWLHIPAGNGHVTTTITTTIKLCRLLTMRLLLLQGFPNSWILAGCTHWQANFPALTSSHLHVILRFWRGPILRQ